MLSNATSANEIIHIYDPELLGWRNTTDPEDNIVADQFGIKIIYPTMTPRGKSVLYLFLIIWIPFISHCVTFVLFCITFVPYSMLIAYYVVWPLMRYIMQFFTIKHYNMVNATHVGDFLHRLLPTFVWYCFSLYHILYGLVSSRVGVVSLLYDSPVICYAISFALPDLCFLACELCCWFTHQGVFL